MAYLIDANGEELRVGSPAVLDNIDTITLICWVYLTATDSTFRRIISKGYADSGTTFTGWGLTHGISGGDQIDFAYGWEDADGAWQSSNPPQATWFNLAITYDAGSTANNPLIYFNAVSQSVNETNAPGGVGKDDSPNPIIIGNIEHGSVDSQRPLNGRIAEVCIHNVILAPNEIKTAMREIVHRGLVGYWDCMDGGTDFSGQANDATVTNATLIGHPPIAPQWGVDIDWPPSVVAAAPGARPQGPLGHPLHGPLAGPIAA